MCSYFPPQSIQTSYYNLCQEYSYLYYFKLFVIFPDGGKHEFHLLDKDELDGYYKYRPDGSTSGWNPNTNSGYCPSDAPLNTKMVYYSVDGTYMRLEFEQDADHNNWSNNPWTLYLSDGTVVERQWLNNQPYGAIPPQVQNYYIGAEFISIRDASGNLVKTAVKDYQYDKNGNVLRIRESDWQEYSSLHDASVNPMWANVASVAFVRTTLNKYYLDAPEASESSTTDPRNANVYNRNTSPRMRNSLKSSELRRL